VTSSGPSPVRGFMAAMRASFCPAVPAGVIRLRGSFLVA